MSGAAVHGGIGILGRDRGLRFDVCGAGRRTEVQVSWVCATLTKIKPVKQSTEGGKAANVPTDQQAEKIANISRVNELTSYAYLLGATSGAEAPVGEGGS